MATVVSFYCRALYPPRPSGLCFSRWGFITALICLNSTDSGRFPPPMELSFLPIPAMEPRLWQCALLGVLATRFQFPRNLDPVIPNDRDSDIAEGTLLLGLIALPTIVYLIMKVMHGGMRDSYVLVAILGLCISIGCVLSQARLSGVAVFAVFLLTDVELKFKFWESAHSFHYVNPSLGLAEFIRDAGTANLEPPIVFASGMIYVPMAHYAPGPLFRKMFYLTDEGKQLTYQRADTFDKHVKILSL